jgi:hypothetical protein
LTPCRAGALLDLNGEETVRNLAAIALALLVGTVPALADVRHIFWKDLRPATQPAAESLGLPVVAASLPDHGETLAWSDAGNTVELKGYALPTDREGEMVYQFLLVPWSGACSHMPTPPPNQIVLVTLPKPFHLERTYAAVSVTGLLKPDLERSQLFIMDGLTVIPSGYSFTQASVEPADGVPDAIQAPQGPNPWSALQKKTN